MKLGILTITKKKLRLSPKISGRVEIKVYTRRLPEHAKTKGPIYLRLCQFHDDCVEPIFVLTNSNSINSFTFTFFAPRPIYFINFILLESGTHDAWLGNMIELPYSRSFVS